MIMKFEKPSKPNRAIIINNAINNILKIFKSGNFPQTVAMSIIHKHSGDNIPSDSWSHANRLLMAAQDTSDARGFRQWQQVNRQVKKGAKAIHIFSPIMKNLTETNKTGEEVKKIFSLVFPRFPFSDMKTLRVKIYLFMIILQKLILPSLMWQIN